MIDSTFPGKVALSHVLDVAPSTSGMVGGPSAGLPNGRRPAACRVSSVERVSTKTFEGAGSGGLDSPGGQLELTELELFPQQRPGAKTQKGTSWPLCCFEGGVGMTEERYGANCRRCGNRTFRLVLDDESHFSWVFYDRCPSCGFERATSKPVPKSMQPKTREEKP